jgi:hypothetical protein
MIDGGDMEGGFIQNRLRMHIDDGCGCMET